MNQVSSGPSGSTIPAWRAVLGLMKPGPDEESSVHPSMVASYRLRTVAVAALISTAAIVVVLVYVGLTRPRGTAPTPSFVLVSVLALGVLAGLVLTPWNRVLATPKALPALYGWCTLGLVVVCIGVYVDGGGASPIKMLLPVLTTFFAVAFAPRAQLLLLVLTIAGYATAVGARNWNTTAADFWIWLSAVVLMAYVASVLSAWLVNEMRNRVVSSSAADQRAGMLSTVARSARRVTSLDVTQVLGGALSGAMELGCHEVEVWQIEGDPAVLTLQRRLAAELTSPNEEVAQVLFDYVRTSGEPMLHGEGANQVLGCPIVREGVIRGVFVVQAAERDLVDALFVECIQLLATQVGAGLDVLHSVAERRGLEERLAHWAFHDSLTDLPNRVLFADRLEQALARVAREGSLVAVLFLDLDNFKIVNDTMGHAAGDALLQGVAQRLQRCLRPNDTLARYGGDEFVILVETVEHAASAVLVAQRVLDELRAPVPVLDKDVVVQTSIGIALTSAQPGAGADVLRRADIAMYQAKAQGGSRFVLSPPSDRPPAGAVEDSKPSI